jgi:hypothetical protein
MPINQRATYRKKSRSRPIVLPFDWLTLYSIIPLKHRIIKNKWRSVKVFEIFKQIYFGDSFYFSWNMEKICSFYILSVLFPNFPNILRCFRLLISHLRNITQRLLFKIAKRLASRIDFHLRRCLITTQRLQYPFILHNERRIRRSKLRDIKIMIGCIFILIFIFIEIGVGLDSFQSNHSAIRRIFDIRAIAVIGEVDLWWLL